jgi:hypothetical protein
MVRPEDRRQSDRCQGAKQRRPGLLRSTIAFPYGLPHKFSQGRLSGSDGDWRQGASAGAPPDSGQESFRRGPTADWIKTPTFFASI